jgi:hypothetical protein
LREKSEEDQMHVMSPRNGLRTEDTPGGFCLTLWG